MRALATLVMVAVMSACTAASGQLLDGDRGRFGVGYDEGLAGRFFFTERLGAQLSVGIEHLGGYDATAYNGGALAAETDASVAGAFVVTILGTKWVYLDALAQFGFASDDTRDPEGIDDRNWLYFRIALAPELLIGDRLGFGFRLGTELVHMGESKQRLNGEIVDTDDDRFNFRFFGPRNPFGGNTLGLSLYVYLGSF